MAVLCQGLNAPALLRALADLSESLPVGLPNFQASAEFLDCTDTFSNAFADGPYVDINYFARFIVHLEAVKIPLAIAYGRHGGDPLMFATREELDSAHLLTSNTDRAEARP